VFFENPVFLYSGFLHLIASSAETGFLKPETRYISMIITPGRCQRRNRVS